MNGLQTSYPDFVPNQILTNTQLNDLRKHLDLQDREGRSRLVGMGIVCGLLWDAAGTANRRELVLSEGLGLTSDGYLICVPGGRYGRVREYIDPAVEANGHTPQYAPWRTSPTGHQRQIFELVSVGSDETAPDDTRLLKEGDFRDDQDKARVLVLYVELAPEELRSCFVTECDNKGQKINVNLRVLLVRQAHLQEVPPCTGPLERVAVPRLHGVAPLGGITRAADIDAGYRRIVEDVTPSLVRRIGEAYEKFGPFLDLDEESHLEPVESVFRPAVLQGNRINQNHYDAVREMAAAYNEFVGAACDLVTDCCPERDFPRHLMLGALDGSEGYRHPFYPSSVRNVVGGDLERARKLFVRMSVMAAACKFGAADEVRLTPSHTEREPLGARAVPHYFALKKGDAEYWQPKVCCTTEKLWSYHDSTERDDLALDDYNRCGLVRIEGHLGDKCADAHRGIAELRRRHNAEFDLLLTSFDDFDRPLQEIGAAIDTLLDRRRDHIAAFRLLAAKSVAEAAFDADAFKRAGARIQEVDEGLRGELDKWAALRCARALHCDTAHLEMLYAEARHELLCVLSGTSAELAAITDAAEALGDQLREESRRLLAAIVGAVHVQVRWLLDVTLPPRLCGFYYPLFIARYKELVEDLTRLWLWWRSLGFPVHDEELDKVVDRPWPAGAESVSAALLAAGRGCFHTRFARIWLGFERVWRNDPSFFPKLVETVDGLEHLAGVQRCGTFVLVCDRREAGAQLLVVADFSLSCRLPCCCDLDLDDQCLPIVALPHHRVVRLEPADGGEFEPVATRIDLSSPGYEPNFRRRNGGGPPLTVKLPAERTELGGKLRLDGAVVEYVHERPRPGLLDTFDYGLESGHECGGKDVAQVSILMEPRPRLPEAPAPRDGIVRGRVTLKGEPIGEIGAVVHIKELRENIPVGTGPAGEPGFYQSRPLPAGTYTLVARFQEFLSDEVQVQVSVGAETAQNLDVTPRNGVVEIVVVDRAGEPIKASKVVLLRDDGTVHAASEQAGAGGAHVFDDVPPGVYLARGAAPHFQEAGTERFRLPSGGRVERAIVLMPALIRVPDRYILRLAVETGEEPAVAAERVRKLFEERYAGRQKRILRSGEIPEVGSSDPYQRAVDFVEKFVTNAEVPTDTLAKGYAKVATGLLRSIAQPAADEEKKTAMRAVLIDVSSAYLDRIVLDQPDELSPEVKRSVQIMTETLRRSEVNPGTFKNGWNATDLREGAGSEMAMKIADMIQ